MTLRIHHGALAVAFLLGGCADVIGFPDYGSGGSSTSTSTSTSTSGGGGSACAPGSTQPCYSGAPATQDVGPCHAGVQVCAIDGGGFGACVGEVAPKAEDCSTPIDDDCDGLVNEDDAGCACKAGDVVACYDGAKETEGVGLCVAGTKTCKPDGTGYDACVGQVLPAVELCTSGSVDESCDGLAGCNGLSRWTRGFGAAGDDRAYDLTAGADGRVVVVGQVAGKVDFGGGLLMGGADSDAFVLELDALGRHVWSKRFGDASAQLATRVAIDAAGNVVIVGEASGAIDLGGGPLLDGGGKDVFVAKLDPSGKHLWSKRFGGAADQSPNGVAIDANGDVLITGYVIDSIDFGGGALTGASPTDPDVFIAKLAGADGSHVWSKRFGDGFYQNGVDLAVDAQGDAFVVGDNNGTINFGGATSVATKGLLDVFVAKLKGTDGSELWSQGFGEGTSDQVAAKAAVSPGGDVVITGSFLVSIDFGGGPLASAAGNDLFVAKLKGVDGAFGFAKGYGVTGAQSGRGVAVDAAGNIVLGAGNSGTIDFGAGPLASGGMEDVVVAKLDGNGATIWAREQAFPGAQVSYAVGTDPLGNVLVAGAFGPAFGFGGGVLATAGGFDIFVAKLAP